MLIEHHVPLEFRDNAQTRLHFRDVWSSKRVELSSGFSHARAITPQFAG